MLVSYYCDLILDLKHDVSSGESDISELFQLIQHYEKNILHCVKFLLS